MKKHIKLLLLAILTVMLCVAIGLSACTITPDDGNDTDKEKIEVDFDERHIMEEDESIESLRPYIAVTYFDKDGNSTVVMNYEMEGKLFGDFYLITVNYKGHSSEFKVMVKAEHKSDEYTVTFKTDEKIVSTQKYTADNKQITVPEVPAKTGYTGQWEEYTLTTGNLTVNAVYTAIEYTVTFKANDQTVDTRTYTVENKNITAPTVPDKTGYTGVWEYYTITIGDMTINAVYTAKQYTVTLNYDGATASNEQETLAVTYGQPIGTLPMPEKTGYEFVGWKYNNEEVTSKSVWATESDATFVAQWKRTAPNEDLEYALNSDGNSYSVMGIGTATDKDIIIPSVYNDKPVTNMGENAFYKCKTLTSVTIPDSITSMGDDAFYGCSNLADINYLGTIESWCKIQGLGELMPYGTSSKTFSLNGEPVTELVIPDTVTSIPSYAFDGCNITSLTMLDSVTSIGYYAFAGCKSLENVNYLGTIESWCKIQGLEDLMRYSASGKTFSLNGEQVTEIEIPSTVTSIPPYAFNACNITSLTFEENSQCTSIGTYAFNCYKLASIMIPDSIISIGDCAFYQCRLLTSITLGNGVTSIGSNAFYYCESLTYINYLGTIESWCNIQGSAYLMFNGYNSKNIKTFSINGVPVAELVIPSTVTSIPLYAFYKTSITSVTFEENSQCTSIGAYAFSSCKSLTSVSIPDSVTSIGENAFSACINLQYNEYGNALYLGDDGNPYRVLVGIKASTTFCSINENTKVIAEGALYFSLTSIIIPNSVTIINTGAFYYSNNLKQVYYNGTAEQWNNIVIENENSNEPLLKATRYYYSESEPALNADGTAYDSNYWHYDTDGKTPVVWKKQ